MNRAISLITIKAVSEDERVIEGIATTPTPDRIGDIVEPLGAKFKLPLPLLWQHKADQPVGFVETAEPTAEGIPFTARFARIDEPGPLKTSIDNAWQAVKAKLVRAVSIGFSIDAFEILKATGGWRITEWQWLELSLVTIPANADATIQSVRSADAEALAASGRKPPRDRTLSAGVTAPRATPVVRAQEGKVMKKTIAEQISAFEATRQAKAARMAEIMDAASEKGETLDQAGQQEYDGLKAELKSIDEHLVRLREHEALQLAGAKAAKGESEEEASRSRAAPAPTPGIKLGQRQLPKGIAFVRYACALASQKGNILQAAEVAKRWKDSTPEVELVLKTAVAAGTTTDSAWAGPLVQYTNMASEFIEYLYPMTIIGRIPGLRRVPFKIKVPRQTGAAAVGWVGEGKPAPLSALAFDSVTLDQLKLAGIIPITLELARLSSPSAELLVRDSLAAAIVKLMDNDFIDPDKAASANVSPASLTSGVTPIASTGTTYDYLKADLKSVLQNFFDANIPVSSLTMLTTEAQALAMSLMETDIGNRRFPNLTMAGGNAFGLPVITSQNIPYTEDSPQEGVPIIFIAANEVMLADDGEVMIDASTEASLQMNTAPDDPATASTVMVSMFQQGMVAIRAERMVNWTKRRSQAVQFIKAAKYA